MGVFPTPGGEEDESKRRYISSRSEPRGGSSISVTRFIIRVGHVLSWSVVAAGDRPVQSKAA